MDSWSIVLMKWLNAIAPSTASPGRLLDHNSIALILTKAKETNLEQCLEKIFIGCKFNVRKSPTMAVSLLLIYISYSEGTCFDDIREVMTVMDKDVQHKVFQFLEHFRYINFNEITIDDLKEARNGTSRNSSTLCTTPVLNQSVCSSNCSPLLQIFQTPTRTPRLRVSSRIDQNCKFCRGAEKVRALENQLAEDDMEKTLLTNQLREKTNATEELVQKLELEKVRSQSLTSDLQNLSEELADFKAKNSSLSEDIRNLKREHHILSDDLSYFKMDAKSAIAERDKLLEQNETLQIKIKEIDGQYMDASSKLKEYSTRNETLAFECTAFKHELRELREFCEKLQAANNKEDSISEPLNYSFEPENLAGLREIVLSEEIETLKNTIAEITTGKESLEKEKESLLDKLAHIEVNSKLLANQNEHLLAVDETKNERIKELMSELGKLSSEKDSMGSMFAETVTELQSKLTRSEMGEKSLEAASKVLSGKIQEAKRIRMKLEKENCDLAQSMDIAINDLSWKLEEKDKEICTLTTDINNVSSTNKKLVEELAASSKERLEENENMQRLNKNLTLKLQEQDREIVDINDKCTKLTEENLKTAEELNSASAQLERTVAKFEKEKNSLMQGIALLNELKTNLEETITNEKSKYVYLEGSATADKNNMVRLCSELEAKIGQLTEDNEVLAVNCEKAQHEAEVLNKVNTINGALEKELQRLNKENQELSAFIDSLRHNYEKVSAELRDVNCALETQVAVERAEMGKRCLRLETELQALNNENQELRNSIELVTCDSERVLSEMRDNYNTLEAKTAEEKLCCSQLETKLQKLTVENEDLTNSMKLAKGEFEADVRAINNDLKRQLSEQRIEMEHRCSELDAKYQKVSNENEELKTALENLEKESQRALADERAINSAIEVRAFDQRAELERRCSELESELHTVVDEKKDLMISLEILRQESEALTGFKTINSDLEEKASDVEQRCLELEAKLQEVTRENYELKNDLGKLKCDFETALADERIINSALEERSSDERTKLESRYLGVEAELQNSKTDNRWLRASLDRIKQEFEETLVNERAQAINQRTDIEKRYLQLEIELQKINNVATELKSSLEIAKQEYEETLTAKTAESDRLRLVCSNLERQVLKFDKEKCEMQKSMVTVQQEVNDVSLKLKEASSMLNEAKLENSTLQNQCSTLKTHLENLERSNEELNRERNELESLRKALVDENLEVKEICLKEASDVNELCSTMKCNLQKLKKDNKDLLSLLERQQKISEEEIGKLKAEKKDLEEENGMITSKIFDLDAKMQSLVAYSLNNDCREPLTKTSVFKTINTAIDQLDALQLEVKTCKEINDELCKNLQSCKDELSIVVQEKNGMDNRLHELKQNIKKIMKALTPECLNVSGEGDYVESISKVLDKIQTFMEAQEEKVKEHQGVNQSYFSEIQSLKSQKRKVLHLIDSMKPKLSVWKSLALRNFENSVDFSPANIKSFIDSSKCALVSATAEEYLDLDDRSLSVEIEALGLGVATAHTAFVYLLKSADMLLASVDTKNNSFTKLEEEYENLEKRLINLTSMNSRLTMEITKSKDLSADELRLKSEELASSKENAAKLKKSVESLNKKCRLLHEENAKLRKELESLERKENEQVDVKPLLSRIESLQTTLTAIKEAAEEQKALAKLLPEIMEVRNAAASALIEIRSKTPEMQSVVSTLEQRVAAATTELLSLMVTLVASTVTSITPTKDSVKALKAKIAEISKKFKSLLHTMKTLSDEVGLIENQCAASPEMLSDSLEEVPVVEKTFEIVNLHDDTFLMPPVVPQRLIKQEQTSGTAFVISPPSRRKKQASQVQHVREKGPSGDAWVIPAVKPVREPMVRSRSAGRPVPSKSAPVKTQQEAMLTRQKVKQEVDLLKAVIADKEKALEQERKEFEASKADIRQRYEKQFEMKKLEMKELYSQVVTKHKDDLLHAKKTQSELKESNRMYKEHIDELKHQVWELSEKLLQEQTAKKELELRQSELSRHLDRFTLPPPDWRSLSSADSKVSYPTEEGACSSRTNRPSETFFAAMQVEDEEEVFDNLCLEELKSGQLKEQDPSRRLTELQIRNSLCLPHLKSSYPAETQFINPQKFPENELRNGNFNFGCDSQSVTDSSGDPSMTRSLLPAEKGKKKEQPSYKKPGPPTPSKLGRLSLGGEQRTPKRALREQNAQQEKGRGTPNRLKALFTSRATKRQSIGAPRQSLGGIFDENVAPTTPRSKGLRIFQRKPFGGREF